MIVNGLQSYRLPLHKGATSDPKAVGQEILKLSKKKREEFQ